MKRPMLPVYLLAAMLAGCDNKPTTPAMPEVNIANCKIEEIQKIPDRTTRETFAGLCSRRSPTTSGIAPTEKPLNWLELADPKGRETKP